MSSVINPEMLNNPSFQQGMVSRGVAPSFTELTESQEEIISPMRSQLQRTGMTDIFAEDSFRQGLQDTSQNRMTQRVNADVGQDLISRAFQANEAARSRQFGRDQNQLNRGYRGSEAELDRSFRGGEADLQRQFGLGQEGRRIQDIQGQQDRQRQMEDYGRQADLFRSGAIDQLGPAASSSLFGEGQVRTGVEQDLLQRSREMGISPQDLQESRRGITDMMARSVAYDPSQYISSPQQMMEREEQMARIAAHMPYQMTGVLPDSYSINPYTDEPYEQTTDLWDQSIRSRASDIESQREREERGGRSRRVGE